MYESLDVGRLHFLAHYTGYFRAGVLTNEIRGESGHKSLLGSGLRNIAAATHSGFGYHRQMESRERMNTPSEDMLPLAEAKGERALIRQLAARIPADGAAVGFGNDLARLETTPDGLLWSVDMLMDGVDFESGRHGWAEIGYKAMAVNLSDCAAAATQPVAALCAVALNDQMSSSDALALFDGAAACGRVFGCPIVGGDTNSWDRPTVISITVAARAETGQKAVTRDGARPGDRIYVSGMVGGSLLGRHLHPEPRIELALRLNRETKPHAMIDISDGLALDLSRVCEASGCGARLDEAALDAVIHPDAVQRGAQTGKPPREHALYDGEDFELIVALPPSVPRGVCEQMGLLPLGEMIAGSGLELRSAAGDTEPLEIRGWEHFRNG